MCIITSQSKYNLNIDVVWYIYNLNAKSEKNRNQAGLLLSQDTLILSYRFEVLTMPVRVNVGGWMGGVVICRKFRLKISRTVL